MVYKKTGVLSKLSEDKSVDVLSESFSRENRKKTAKNEMPLVSVITVVFNREKEIEKTIKSVISQSYENIEYIIIDGNSTDNTLSVIKKYSNRINYYASANDQGIYQAMNRGVKLAQGDYISLINAGDCMDSNFVELSINLLIKHKTENILSYCKLVGEECPSSFNSGLLTYHMNINHQTFLVSKHVYNSVGLYSEDFQVASDIKWTRDAFLYGVKAVFVNQELITFEKGGLSDGTNSYIRKTIVKENILDYKLRFPFLTDEESESLYNFRFNKYIIHSILDLIARHENRSFLFVESIKYYFKYCLMHRNNFSIDFYEIDALFPVFVNLIKELDLSYNLINLDVDGNNKFPYYIKQVENIRNTSKDKKTLFTMWKFLIVLQKHLYTTL